MPVSEGTIALVGRALAPQRYRYVDATSLISPAVRFPVGVNEPLSSVLEAVGSEPHWVQVGHQLATLRDNPGFRGLWVRRDSNSVGLVVAYAFTGVLNVTTGENYLEQTWQTISRMHSTLGTFNLSSTNLGVLARSFGVAGNAAAAPAPPPPTKPIAGSASEAQAGGIPEGEDAGPIGEQRTAAASQVQNSPTTARMNPWLLAQNILGAFLAFNFARSADCAALLISDGGMAADFTSKADNWIVNWARSNVQGDSTGVVGVDARNSAVHGTSLQGSLDVADFRSRLQFLD
jgi:hypothetical protein